MMTRRERVLQAVNHKETDFVPYTVEPTTQAYESVVDYVQDSEYVAKIGDHMAHAIYNGHIVDGRPLDNKRWRDDFGVV